ncbi:Zn-dependent metalloprotease [Nocardioides sp. BE266]|uniref:M4 family metallopeptidase n=1 Tax=Nocardioides sp. BE266 TaxID=2817725 RepID=UPI0028600F8C|nr:M4 family metallopeptidase [Nocardioides sp. BE266]MDR7254435.1 Zn-dependent metalloprotease [Nocardioides sp. BE266]
MLRKKVTAALATAAVVAGGQLAWAGAQAAPDPAGTGLSRLQADVTAGLRIERNGVGAVDFVGTAAGSSIVNPAVSADSGIRDAARAHLSRYGSALGADDADLAAAGTTRSPSGQDVVRFQQDVAGAPVIGGQVVVSLRGDRQLGSILSTLSTVRALPAATVAQADARSTALRSASRKADASGLSVTSQGRQVWDPAVFGATAPARGVWSFEVGDGAAVRRLVLVDDTTGRVLLDIDQVEHLDRVVCDRNNVRGDATACTSGFARTEGQAATGITDVDKAYDYAGEVATAYQQLAGIDLTDKLGVDVGGVKKLAATVRFCYTSTTQDCPYANAFWNGTQMFYGDGFAAADDVVGHEMTHGVVDQYSELFYWGQSGAMNESIADIMGEVIDHRNGADDDSQWKLSEDLSIGAIRDMLDPTSFNDPDKMTSTLYNADLSYTDSGGVHTNSGVGNKTAYLISQGGTFNGQTITGIDGADAGLTKTGKLYFDAITKLTSGSDYANLASVLEQSCADFVTSGIAGFTSADCTNITKAVAATELRTTPTNAPQPADAVRSCPTGTTMRELFNSETGSPSTKMVSSAAGMWGYGVNPSWGSNATSGKDSWLGWNPDPSAGDPAAASLTTAAGIALPAGQKSFLHFQHWNLFEWYPGRASGPYMDGGTVEVDGVDTAGLPWTNGPSQTLSAYNASNPNQWAGLKAFGGDSFGWSASQVDLSSYAGRTVKPSFTSRGDGSDAYIGWWLDDISVYTCDVPPVVTPPAPTPTPTPVVKLKSTTKLKVTTGHKVTIVATVKASGPKPTGKVSFTLKGKKKVTKAVAVKKGKATLVVTGKIAAKLGSGKVKVKAAYTGSTTVLASTAKARFNLR